MHEFIRLVKSFLRRHRPARPVPSRIDWPDTLDMHATPNLGRVESEFKEAARQYENGEISYDQFRIAINLGGTTHIYADEQMMNLKEAQKIMVETARRNRELGIPPPVLPQKIIK